MCITQWTYKLEPMLQRTFVSFSEYKVTHFIQKRTLLRGLGERNREQGKISELRPCADTLGQQKGGWRAGAWKEETLLLLEALLLP